MPAAHAPVIDVALGDSTEARSVRFERSSDIYALIASARDLVGKENRRRDLDALFDAIDELLGARLATAETHGLLPSEGMHEAGPALTFASPRGER